MEKKVHLTVDADSLVALSVYTNAVIDDYWDHLEEGDAVADSCFEKLLALHTVYRYLSFDPETLREIEDVLYGEVD